MNMCVYVCVWSQFRAGQFLEHQLISKLSEVRELLAVGVMQRKSLNRIHKYVVSTLSLEITPVMHD